MNIKLIIVAVAVLLLLIFGIRYGNRLIQTAADRDLLEKNKSLDDAARSKGEKPSYTGLEYESMASKIQVANQPWYYADDVESVRAVFQKMKNTLDISLLIKAFGIRSGMALAAYLYDFLNASELEQYVNQPLRGNGLTFQF